MAHAEIEYIDQEWEERKREEEDESGYLAALQFEEERDYMIKLAASYPQDTEALFAKRWLERYA